MISFSEAKSLISRQSQSYKKRLFKININKAVRYVLAENIKAKYDSPPFNQSAMDGYAFTFADLSKFSCFSLPAELENRAGNSKIKIIPSGHAVRIFTGAKTPTNGDLVVPQEYVTLTENKIEFNSSSFSPFDNIRLKGSQFKKGEILIKKGEILSAAKIALAASAGYNMIQVYDKPKVAIIVTGSELIPPGKPLSGDKVYESNSVMLHSLLIENNIQSAGIQFVKDEIKTTTNAIQKALKNADVILISGGISVGKYDLIKDILEKLKTKTIFHRIKQKPGKPLYFGKNKNTYVFGLPGNPAASLTCFFEYVLPFLKSLSGYERTDAKSLHGKITANYYKKPGLTHFLKGFAQNGTVSILPDQESYKITSFAEANCLIVIPEETTSITEGDLVEYRHI